MNKSDVQALYSHLQSFEATEHKEIGNRALKILLEKYPEIVDPQAQDSLRKFINPSHCLIKLNERVMLSAGDWVALAGDFFGIPEKPITGMPNEDLRAPNKQQEREDRFLAAYQTLAGIDSDEQQEELEKLVDAIRDEDNIVKETLKKRDDGQSIEVSDALHSNAMKQNKIYAQITAKSIVAKFLIPGFHLGLVGLTMYTRYLALLETNFDHFGSDAHLAYEAGHAVAIRTAIEAGKMGDPNESSKKFVEALTQELFACHFLSDAFASGHLRVPRRELCEQVRSPKVAGLLANVMHNEDGEMGLQVTNHDGTVEPWLARGDGCLFDIGTEENHKKVIDTVFLALESIYKTYRKPEIKDTFDYKLYVPHLVEQDYSQIDKPNHPPLFQVVEDTVMYRGELSPNKPAQFTEKWNPYITLAKLWFLKKPNEKFTVDELAKSIEEEVEEISYNKGKVNCVLL